MHPENTLNTSIGIHFNESSFCAAYYRNDMPEAELIINPETGDKTFSLVFEDENILPAEALKKMLQKHLDYIFGLLGEGVGFICFTTENLSESSVCELLPILDELDLRDAAYALQEDNESFYDFVTFQNNDLWTNEVVLFVENDKKLYAKSLMPAGFPHEKALTVRCKEFNDFDFGNENEDTDRQFNKLLESFFDKRLVSCVFLQGETFSKNWMKNTLKFLCKNRRVFGVNDIIVKGACYRGFRKNPTDMKTRYYMGTHQIPFNIGMVITEDGRDEICRLVRAGTNWYDADFMWHFMINDIDTLHFRTDPAIMGVQRYIDIDISKFPHRPKFATKIEVSIHFAGYNRWYIKVCDLGLGELYPSEHTEAIAYIGEW